MHNQVPSQSVKTQIQNQQTINQNTVQTQVPIQVQTQVQTQVPIQVPIHNLLVESIQTLQNVQTDINPDGTSIAGY
jgi:hypothetical protein